MSLYGHNQLSNFNDTEFEDQAVKDLVETYFVDDISRMNSEQIKEFCTSDQAQVLVEKSVLQKPTLMRLSKEDDEKRRIKLACFYIAKAKKDPNYDKMVKFHGLWKKYRGMVFKKYYVSATRIAKKAQREYIKRARSSAPAQEEHKEESK